MTEWLSLFSHLYMTTGKTTALTIWTFVSKVMSLLFNTLSRFVTAFLPRFSLASLVAQMLKHLPAMWETWVRYLGWEDPLEKKMATHSSILAWRIPWMEEPGGLQSTGSQRVGHDWATSFSFSLSSKEQVSFNFVIQPQSVVILEPKKIKSIFVAKFSPCICYEMMDNMILVFLTVEF